MKYSFKVILHFSKQHIKSFCKGSALKLTKPNYLELVLVLYCVFVLFVLFCTQKINFLFLIYLLLCLTGKKHTLTIRQHLRNCALKFSCIFPAQLNKNKPFQLRSNTHRQIIYGWVVSTCFHLGQKGKVQERRQRMSIHSAH